MMWWYLLAVIILLIIIAIYYFYHLNNKTAYLDNNATTEMLQTVKDIYNEVFIGNPSAHYADKARDEVQKSRETVAHIFKAGGNDVIFTSGASESNAQVVHSLPVNSHVVCSAIEHDDLLEALKNRKDVEITWVDPRYDGAIWPIDVAAAIKPNTVAVFVMWANNETGIINRVAEIGTLCRSRGVLFHCDATQIMGKISMPEFRKSVGAVDCISCSMHKFGGPPGMGLLVCRKRGFLKPLIWGHQQGGLRGGTENVPGIIGTRLAFENWQNNWKDHSDKRDWILEQLAQMAPIVDSKLYSGQDELFHRNKIEFVKITKGNCLPNTLLFSVVFPPNKAANGRMFCNVIARKCLANAGVFVSIASACKTSVAGSSHVLNAMKLPFHVRAGVLRISVGDRTTWRDCSKFIKQLEFCIKQQLKI